MTNVWSDNWIPRDERRLPYVALIDEPPSLVVEFIDNVEGAWSVEKLEHHLLPVDVDVIKLRMSIITIDATLPMPLVDNYIVVLNCRPPMVGTCSD